MGISRSDLFWLTATSLICSAPVTFLTFEFMLPNMSFPPIGKNLLAIFLLAILTGVPAGYLNERTKYAVTATMSYTFIGYLVSILFYSVPYTVFRAELVLSDLYYAQYVRFTVILIFIFVFGGIVGVVIGQYLKDSIRREETKVAWAGRDEGPKAP